MQLISGVNRFSCKSTRFLFRSLCGIVCVTDNVRANCIGHYTGINNFDRATVLLR
jgi:hypothetical protein